MRTYRIDGRSVTDLASLCEAFARAVGSPAGSWGATLFSFDDRLVGGYGLVAPCEIVWEYSAVSREQLDSAALVRWCERLLESGEFPWDPGRPEWELSLKMKEKAARGERALFDEVVECITSASERTPEPGWKIDLILR